MPAAAYGPAAVNLVAEQWVDSSAQPQVLYSGALGVGAIVQIVTHDAGGQVDGSALLVVSSEYAADMHGKFLECRFGGCSHPAYTQVLTMAFPAGAGPGQSLGILHLCNRAVGDCVAAAGGRQVIHVTSFRLRELERVNDPWGQDLVSLGARAAAPLADVAAQPVKEGDAEALAQEPGFKGLAAELLAGPGPREKRHRSHGSSSESAVEADDTQQAEGLRVKLLKKKVASESLSPSERLQFQSELATLERKAARRKRKAKSGKHERKGRSRRRRRSSSSDSSSRESSASGFRKASSRNVECSDLVRMHEKKPGKLYDQAIVHMARYLGARGGATSGDAATQWVTYLNSILLGTANPNDIPEDMLQELRTLCEALNMAGRGEPKSMCDLLTQRFMALEARLTGQKELARGLELVNVGQRGLASNAQLRAARRALRDQDPGPVGYRGR